MIIDSMALEAAYMIPKPNGKYPIDISVFKAITYIFVLPIKGKLSYRTILRWPIEIMRQWHRNYFHHYEDGTLGLLFAMPHMIVNRSVKRWKKCPFFYFFG
jgi:hypothetical protein